jgi:hypothetical protein
MKKKVETLRAALAIIFADLAKKSEVTGLAFKYESGPIKIDGEKLWRYAISVKELGYPERTIQEWTYIYPKNIDRFNMEYNVLMNAISSFTETALLTWNELGKQLNTDVKLQEAAKESLKND